MKSIMHRRHFLQTGALALGALCTSSAGSAHATRRSVAAERTAHGFVGKYSDRFTVVGQNGGMTRLVALVRDLPSFSKAIFGAKEAGISNLRFDGTVATFQAGGRAFEVENLMAEDFAALDS